MKATTGFLISLLMVTFLHASLALPTECIQRKDRPQDLRPIAGSCTKFHMCSMGTLIPYTCPSGSVFHEASGSCVPEGSEYDTCTKPSYGRFTTACPRGATYKKPHPQHCARFYDCGKPAMEVHWEDHEQECQYPMLFNEETKRCEHYSMVSCGSRHEPFDRCEYLANECNGHAHCRPCQVRYASCRGMTDGMNEWKGKLNSPFFVVCNAQRVVYSGMCPQDFGEQVFDRRLKVCVPVPQNKAWWQ